MPSVLQHEVKMSSFRRRLLLLNGPSKTWHFAGAHFRCHILWLGSSWCHRPFDRSWEKPWKKLRKTNKACTASDVILCRFLKSLVLSVSSPCLWTPGESVTATRKALLVNGISIMNHEWWGKKKICGYHMMLPAIVLNHLYFFASWKSLVEMVLPINRKALTKLS